MKIIDQLSKFITYPKSLEKSEEYIAESDADEQIDYTVDESSSLEEEIYDLPYNMADVGGYEMHSLSLSEISGVFNLSIAECENLLERVKAKAKNYGKARALKASTYVEQDGNLYLTSIGIYILVTIASDYKKYSHLSQYKPSFKNLAFRDLLGYFTESEVSRNKKKRRPANGFGAKSEEELMGYHAKVVDVETRTPDLENVEDKSHWLYGKSIVVTGNFVEWPNRQDLVILITSHGGFVKTSISKKTNYVIMGTDAGPAKMRQIEDIGTITVYNEDEFLSVINI